jgi:hypothetical protein
LWTFDVADLPDDRLLRRVQDVVLANIQSLVKAPANVRFVASGRAPEAAFWCFYVPENFKTSQLSESLADFDAPDQVLALRLRNRLSWVQRRDPRWTWIEAILREMARNGAKMNG